MRWNGAVWSFIATIGGSPTLYSVDIHNASLIFAVGIASNIGRIYISRDMGSTWSLNFTGNSTVDIRGVKILNNTIGYAVGDNGYIYIWNRTRWLVTSSPITDRLYRIKSTNDSNAYIVGGDQGRSVVLRFNGQSWATELDQVGDRLRDLALNGSKAYAFGNGAVVLEKIAGSWIRNFDIPRAYEGNLTTGYNCPADDDQCSDPSSFPARNANYSSCRAHLDLNATVHSIGFGPISSCSFAIQTMRAIAACGNGSYYASSNASELNEIYNNLAIGITNQTIAYLKQKAIATGVSSTLYEDSYLEIHYNKTGYNTAQKIPVTFEGPIFNNTISQGGLVIPDGTEIIDAKATSYSGADWTNIVDIENSGLWQTVFNLSEYGNNYLEIGDPYSVYVPVSLIALNNTIRVRTAISPNITGGGSPDNRVIYTLLVKTIADAESIGSKREGCMWVILYEDGSSINITLPEEATTGNICYFQTGVYDSEDVLQSSVYNLLLQLDLDSDGLIDVDFDKNGFSFNAVTTTDVPYLWGPATVEVRVWQ